MKKISILIFALCCVLTTHAQNILHGPIEQIYLVRSISPNGKYVVGQHDRQPRPAFLWELDSGNRITLLGNTRGEATAVTDNRIIAGDFMDPDILYEGEPVLSAGRWENGTWTGLGLGVGAGQPLPNNLLGSSARGMTADGNMIVGLSRKNETGIFHAHPYSWTKTGDTWVGQLWSDANGPDVGASIVDISGDGSIAVGYTTLPGTSDRKGIVWRSPTDYTILFANVFGVGEYTCISENGHYAGFRHAQQAGIHNLVTGEITIIPQGHMVGAVSNDGFLIGVYHSPYLATPTDKGFVWNEELGFMDFGEFVSLYAPDIDLPVALNSLDVRNPYKYTIHTMTPDGLNITILTEGLRIKNAYVLSLENPITVLPFPRNFTAEVSRPDRDKVNLAWDATGNDVLQYIIYRDNDSLTVVNGNVDTYLDEDVPVGYHDYSVQAVYDNGRSRKSEMKTVAVVDNYNLPLLEDFNSNSLRTNFWTATSDYGRSKWETNEFDGVEAVSPGLRLEVNNSQGNYAASLLSKPLDARGATNVYLSYMTYLMNYATQSSDTLFVEIYDGNAWTTVNRYVFPRTTMDWKNEWIDITDVARGEIINVRFRMEGENSSTDLKTYFFDNIFVTTALPTGDAIPRKLVINEEEDNAIKLIWQDPSGLYGITHSQTPNRGNFGNLGDPFIAVQDFTTEDLEYYYGHYLTSISVYINNRVWDPEVETTLKLAVYQNGQRTVSTDIDDFVSNAWNNFNLPNAIAINSGLTDLKIGVEVVTHDSLERPIGADEDGRVVAGKGDLYSEDGGATWKRLSSSGDPDQHRNWSIIGNISETATPDEERNSDIIGYNLYLDGVKINDYLIYRQELTNARYGGCYTVRAFSLELGLSATSEQVCIEGPSIGMTEPEQSSTLILYPNPASNSVRINQPFKNATLFDLNGRVIIQTNSDPIPVDHLQNGMYMLRIETQDGIFNRKLLINN